MFKTPILMLKMKFFWLIFRGKFEQKTQNSIFLKNQWRLKNIKKAMVVKNIIAEDMAFTKSIFEQFWRSYWKKTIFVVFHFLKFLPKYISQVLQIAQKPIIDFLHTFIGKQALATKMLETLWSIYFQKFTFFLLPFKVGKSVHPVLLKWI